MYAHVYTYIYGGYAGIPGSGFDGLGNHEADGMVLHLHLRNGVHFAEDVVAALLRLGCALLRCLVASDGVHISMLL